MGDILSGIDLCFDPRNPGTPNAEGEYPLGFGLIEMVNGSWVKVTGYSENVTKNTDFVITLYDLSQTLASIAFVTVAWRPDSDDASTSATDSPFTNSDFDEMERGKVLSASQPPGVASCGCGSGGSTVNGNQFAFGHYTIKNSGEFEVTIAMRVIYNGQTMTFKCDPKIIVGS